MRRPLAIHRPVLGALALPCVAALWWGCAEQAAPPEQTGSGAGGSSLTLSTGTTTTSSSGVGGFGVGGDGGGVICTSTLAKAEKIPVDLVFVIDQSGSMAGTKWTGTKAGLTKFFEDPASTGISAGLLYFPRLPNWCDYTHYLLLDVPIVPLPGNAFALTNTLPATATGVATPLYPALKGGLMAAIAYQDANPTHKVNVVFAGDGNPEELDDGIPPSGCELTPIADIAALAKEAKDYNGVNTYVIGMQGSIMSNLDKIAAAGGTTAAYDITDDINLFSAAMAEIRTAELACEFSLPPPPEGMALVPDQVNFTYKAGDADEPVVLPHADDLADCGDQPGWYYDNNFDPTKIIVCPASCATIQNDALAEVGVAFGCETVLN